MTSASEEWGVTSDIFPDRGQTIRIRFHLPKGSNKWTDEDVLGRVAYSCADEGDDRIGIGVLERIPESVSPVLARRLNAL